MERYIQVVAGAIIAVILGIALSKYSKDVPLVLSILVCCMVLAVAFAYMEPILDFLQELKILGQLNSDMMEILLKAVGIGLVAEIAGLICADAGNAALGKAIQILASVVVLWLSIPLMRLLLEMVEKIMEEV